MKEKIEEAIKDAGALENLYRSDPGGFAPAFTEVAEKYDTELVRFWKIRLRPASEKTGTLKWKKELLPLSVILAAMILSLRLPALIPGLNNENFYMRFFPLIVFSGLTAWFIWKNNLTEIRKIIILTVPVLLLLFFLIFLSWRPADTVILALIHAPLYMWFVFGMAWLGFRWKDLPHVSAFIRFNGELAIMTGLILIALFILSGMTISLFALLGMEISRFYMENIAVVGMALSPVLAALLMDKYPEITGKIPPLIARIFAPVVLVSAVIYLIAMAFSGISIRENREFLLVFNLLLLGVMAIIVFTISAHTEIKLHKFLLITLFLLSVVTLIIDLFALQAIFSRLAAGITPNRTAVLVSNLLILVNLILIIPALYRAAFLGSSPLKVEKQICRYLPVYFLYSIVIIYIFPLIFGIH
jgi:hypothetical protein